jgi:hypothetical protein
MMIQCVTPAGSAGPADVTVTNPDSTTVTAQGAFTYSNQPPPHFTSLPRSPGAVLVGQAVTLTASAVDAAGNALTCSWDFGDGTTATGNSVTHTYTASGVYIVTVSASDGINTISDSIIVAVCGANKGGTSPTGKAANALTVVSTAIKFNFESANSDSLTMTGTLPVPANIFASPAGKSVSVTIGGLERDFVLDATGKASGAQNSIKFFGLGRLSNSKYASSPVKFTLVLKAQTLFNDLADLGFADPTKSVSGASVNIPVAISLDGNGLTAVKTVKYSAKAGVGGRGK